MEEEQEEGGRSYCCRIKRTRTTGKDGQARKNRLLSNRNPRSRSRRDRRTKYQKEEEEEGEVYQRTTRSLLVLPTSVPSLPSTIPLSTSRVPAFLA